MKYQFKAIDHVQLAAPIGSEEEARSFYVGVLGFKEVEKPESLKKSGGVWFQSGPIQLHIGIEESFQPARKAHPALAIENLKTFSQYLTSKQISFKEDHRIPGANRIHLFDPFGNRLEVIEWV